MYIKKAKENKENMEHTHTHTHTEEGDLRLHRAVIGVASLWAIILDGTPVSINESSKINASTLLEA